MGNGLSPCMHMPAAANVKLVYWGGQTRLIADDGITAGDVTAELAGGEHVVCAADSFYVGLPIPAISSGEELLLGRAYFVLPADRFSCFKVLTAAALAALSPAPATGKKKVSIAGPGQCPFEYVKGADGGAPLIRVLPEFIEKVIGCRADGAPAATAARDLCSTPELKRHYAMLVGGRRQPWSPGLETIAEGGKKSGRILRLPAARILSAR